MIDANTSISKAVGNLENLKTEFACKPSMVRTGVCHTISATHSACSILNAHPHRVEPNGIHENYSEL